MAAQSLTYSPEQQEIHAVRSGGLIVTANAGTGKSTTTAGHIVECYEQEEKVLFPGRSQRVEAEDQEKILRQFTVVTFTVPAAAELDAKVKEVMAVRGIPVPERRICRTLDSYVQGWLRRERVFQAWMDSDPEVRDRIAGVIETMPTATQDALRRRARGDTPVAVALSFHKVWDWILPERVQTMILDTLIRKTRGQLLPGCDPNKWTTLFIEHLKEFSPPADGRWSTRSFWDARLARWQEHQDRLRSWAHSLQVMHPPAGVSVGQVTDEVKAFQEIASQRDEFLSVYELARARSYHPTYCPDKVLDYTVEEQLAACIHIKSYAHFHDLAVMWNKAKGFFAFRDFSDATSSLVRLLEARGDLLERNRAYPSLIRTKYLFWDEAQDNSALQHRLINFFFARDGHEWFTCLVGDYKQLIYGWRGAAASIYHGMITKKREREPGMLKSLTTSYRSLKRIVALGNEIVSTLPSYRDTVLPSSTVYTEDGKITIPPVFNSLAEEAHYVEATARHFLDNSAATVMVLTRTAAEEHPYFERIKSHPEFRKRLSCLTIHASKGLQADVVFVLGMTAGKMPDYRSDYDGEVNLFYVAVTRARRILYLCGQVAKRGGDSVNRQDEYVGVSPFFWQIPSLRNLAKEAGWNPALMEHGVEAHDKLARAFNARVGQRREILAQERYTLFPQSRKMDRHVVTDTGAVKSENPMTAVTPMSMGDLGTANSPRIGSPFTRVFNKLAAGYRRNGRVPHLSDPDDFRLALKEGWLERDPENQKRWRFTAKFVERAREAA